MDNKKQTSSHACKKLFLNDGFYEKQALLFSDALARNSRSLSELTLILSCFQIPPPPALVVLIKSLPEPPFPHLSNGKARRIGELKHGEGWPRHWLTVDTRERPGEGMSPNTFIIPVLNLLLSPKQDDTVKSCPQCCNPKGTTWDSQGQEKVEKAGRATGAPRVLAVNGWGGGYPLLLASSSFPKA